MLNNACCFIRFQFLELQKLLGFSLHRITFFKVSAFGFSSNLFFSLLIPDAASFQDACHSRCGMRLGVRSWARSGCMRPGRAASAPQPPWPRRPPLRPFSSTRWMLVCCSISYDLVTSMLVKRHVYHTYYLSLHIITSMIVMSAPFFQIVTSMLVIRHACILYFFFSHCHQHACHSVCA